jgi:hypothetical protein
MPANIIELYVPCRLIEVTVSVAPAEHLSRLEKLVLRAMHAGVTQFRELVNLFGLGQRPTLDLVSDLWHRGYLALDMEKSELWLTEGVKRAIESEKLDHLSAGEVQERKAQVAQELISGHILRPPRRPTQVQRSRIVPVEYHSRPLRPEHRQEVIGVLDEVLMRALSQGRGAKVLAVNFGLFGVTEQTPTPMHERRLMEVRVECTRHARTDRLSFQILHPAALPVRVRKSMERGLGKLTAELHQHQFARTMRDRAEQPSIIERLEPAEAAQRLSAQCSNVTESIPGKLSGLELHEWARIAQDKLELAALPAREGAEELLLSQHEIELVSEERHYTQLIGKVLTGAKHQLILCLPTLKYAGLQSILSHLEMVLRDGVSVFILWGREPDTILDTDVNNRLAALQQEHRRLFIAKNSSRVGSFAMIQDKDLALVSSSDPLARLPDRVHLLGVLLRPRTARQGGAIEDLITFCREAFPEHRTASLMETAWSTQGEQSTVETPLPEFPQLLPAADVAWKSDKAPIALSLWREQWQQYAQQITHSVSLPTSTANLLTDGQIREVFWGLIGRRQRQLTVISQRLDSDVVNSKLMQVLEERLRDQTRVTILFSETADPATAGRMEEIMEKFPGQMLIQQMPARSLRSECVISDERVLLTSLQLLCVSGEYVGSQRYRLARHIGLVLHGSEVVQSILSGLRQYNPEAAGAIPGPVRAPGTAMSMPPPPRHVPPPALTLLSKLTAVASDPAQQAAVLREWFHGMPTPQVWASLDQLHRARLPEIWLAVVCALGVAPHHLKTPEGQEWQARLAAHTWHVQHCPQQTWLLLHDWPALAAHATLAQLPRLPIVALAAVQDRPALFSRRQQALGESLSDESQIGVAALSIMSVLRHGNSEAAFWLETRHEQLASPLNKLAIALLRYFSRTANPYPLAELMQQSKLHGAREEQGRMRTELRAALAEARQIKTAFTLMRATWDQLFAPTSSLASLEQIVSQAGSVADWWRVYGKTDRQLEDWLDEQSQEAGLAIGWRGPMRIERGPRASSLHRLRAIFATACKLANLDAALAAAPRLHGSSYIELARELSRLRGPLRDFVESAERHRTPPAPLLRSLRDALRVPMETTT